MKLVLIASVYVGMIYTHFCVGNFTVKENSILPLDNPGKLAILTGNITI